MFWVQKESSEFSASEHVEAELTAINEAAGVKVKSTTPDLMRTRPNMSPYEARLPLLY